jgi:hypothetical protein
VSGGAPRGSGAIIELGKPLNYEYSVLSISVVIFQNGIYVTVSGFVNNGYVLSVILLLATLLQHTLVFNHNILMVRDGVRMRSGFQVQTNITH